MKRSRRLLVVCHCLLNVQTKVYPLARYPGVFIEALKEHWEKGHGLFQLPCPEITYLGMNRWGMTREQYDHPNFRRHCERLLEPVMDQLVALHRAGCDIVGVVGMDGSPNCGVHWTCEGFEGGDLDVARAQENLSRLRLTPGFGVFMGIFKQKLIQEALEVSFGAVKEQGEHGETFIEW